jgi:hypothetical protein
MNYKLSKNQIYIATCVTILLIMIISYFKFPINHRQVGDESSYFQEVEYFAKYGFFKSLSQGASFFYTILIYTTDKLFFIGDFLKAARVLNMFCFVAACFVLYKCITRFANVLPTTVSMSLLYFAVICSGWCCKGLPDIPSLTFSFSAIYLLTGKGKKVNMALGALCLLLAFAIKPTAVFYFPWLFIAIIILGKRDGNLKNGIVNALVFTASFAFIFFLYHIPGYMVNDRLMLEDKNHTYVGETRVENVVSWNDANVYFEQYNPQKKENIWAITMEEVDSFRTNHPEKKLYDGHIAFALDNPAVYIHNTSDKLFLILPYSIQYGFFFAKWTLLNKFISSIFMIKLITLLLIAGMYWKEAKFVKTNLLFLSLAAGYYLFLSMYVFAQMQDNWILCCLPLLAIPVAKFLADRIHILLLMALQVIFVLL